MSVIAKKRIAGLNKQKKTTAERIVFGIAFVLFSIYAVVIAYPFLFLIMKSVQNVSDYLGVTWTGAGSPPSFYYKSGLAFGNFLRAFTDMKQSTPAGEVGLLGMFFNSLWFTAAYIVFGVLASAFTGYNLAKYKFPGSEFIYAIAIFSMTIPIVGNSGALYKFASDIGIYNTPLFVLCTAPAAFSFQFLVLYGFFKNVSWNYAEAVFIDGGGHFTVFFKIMLPQAMPAMGTLGILSFITYWNNYQTVLMYLPSFPTLASGLYVLELVMRDNKPVYFAGLLIMVVPVLAVFAGFSNVIMSNLSVGGLKG